MKSLPHGTVTLIVILAGSFLIYQSGALNKAVSIAEDAANHNSENILAIRKPFQAKLTILDHNITLKNAKIADLDSSLALIAAENSSLRTNLSLAKTPGDTIKVQSDIIVNLTSENKTLNTKCAEEDSIVTECQRARFLMQTRIDTLEHTLSNQVGSTKCKILFFGCPTRLAFYEAGAATGAIIVLILKGLLH